MKLLFSKGLLGTLVLFLILSFDAAYAMDFSEGELCLEKQIETAVPFASGDDLEELILNMGYDKDMLPPVAWSAERDTSGTVDIKQKLSHGGLVIIEWSSSSANNFEVYNSNTTLLDYQVTLTGSGPFNINVRACEDDVEEIYAEYQDLTAMDVSKLSGLKKVYARNNKLGGVLDFRASINLETCHIFYNNYGSTAGNHTLKIYLSEVYDLNLIHSAIADTLDLSTCSNLFKVYIYENEITHLVLPTSTQAPNLSNIQAFNNVIENSLDFSNFPNLALISFDNNKVSSVQVDNLPKLTYFNANDNQLRGTLDFSSSPLLDECFINRNNFGANSGSWTLQLILNNVRNLQIIYSEVVDTLDLSTCTALSNALIYENKITHLILPTSSQAPNLSNIHAFNNVIENSLDFSNFPNLALIRFDNNKVSSVQVDNLPKLTYFNANDNQLRGTLDFSSSPLLDECFINRNNFGANSGSWTLQLILNNVRNLQIIYSEVVDTLDLSTCTALSNALIYENKITHLILPTSSQAPNLSNIQAFNNVIENSLDFSNFPNLASIRFDNNRIQSVQVDSLPQLTYFNAHNNQLRDTLDFSASPLLDECFVAQNNHGSNTGAWTLHLILDKVRNLQIYRSAITGTLDLGTCTNLEYIYAHENDISAIILPPAPNASPSGLKIPIKYINLYDTDLNPTTIDDLVTAVHGHAVEPSSTSNGYLNIDNNEGNYTLNTTTLLGVLDTTYNWTITQ